MGAGCRCGRGRLRRDGGKMQVVVGADGRPIEV